MLVLAALIGIFLYKKQNKPGNSQISPRSSDEIRNGLNSDSCPQISLPKEFINEDFQKMKNLQLPPIYTPRQKELTVDNLNEKFDEPKKEANVDDWLANAHAEIELKNQRRKKKLERR